MFGYPTYAYGHDMGNSETCGFTETHRGQMVVTLPSTLHRGGYEELVRIIGASSMSDGEISVLDERSHVVRFIDQGRNQLELFAGDLALQQAQNVPMSTLTGRGQVTRYWDYRTLAMLLVTSGTLIPDTEYGLQVVTNLPVSTHTPTNVERVKGALDGTHHFSLDGKKRTVHVKVRKVTMEGSGANVLYGDGKQKMLVIDIGGRTTDGYTVHGLRPIPELCKSFDIGLETATDRIQSSFEDRFDFPLSTQDLHVLMRVYLGDKQYKNIPSVMNSGVSNAEVEQLVYGLLREVGQDILGRIRGGWNLSFKSSAVAGDVSVVVSIGGGSYYFQEELKGMFTQRLRTPKFPERVNAQAGWHLAKMLMKRDQSVTQGV